MNVVIFGANGQLGSDIAALLEKDHHVIRMTHDQLDLSDLSALKAYLNTTQPQVIINSAAYHHVEMCEQHPELASAINTAAPEVMADYAHAHQALFIHFSTDYVFDGNKQTPYVETDNPAPLNVYGRTKSEGEFAILKADPSAMILRVSGLYGSNPCRAKNGLNFVQLMLKLAKERGEVKVVNDEFVSPTYTLNIAAQVTLLLQQPLSGIIHCTSGGQCSWNEFAAEIFSYTHTPVKLEAASSTDFPAKVPRPKYSVLENSKLKAAGLDRMPDWKTALHSYLDSFATPQS